MTYNQISVRIDQATKDAAESVFNTLGLSATDAVRMFYRQVALQSGLPFAVKVPNVETCEAIKELDEGGGKKYSLKEFKEYIATIKS